jgi:ATP-binding cassette subfamily F protein uup
MAETLLSADRLSVKYSSHVVLDDATAVVCEGDRIGVVGRNGSGKSTFLRIAAGAMEPDSGTVVRRRELVTGYLPQVFDLDESESVQANILAGVRPVLAWIHEYESSGADTARSAELLEKINHAGGWNIEHRIKSLSTNLGAPDASRIVGTLSGGEKRRAALCRALVAQPDLLILDEPTNHLDTESIQWLEDFLASYPGACLFVTHDRYFLDRIATRILELSSGRFFSHEGNYTDYLLGKAARQSVEEQEEERRRKFLKREIEWIRRAPRARRTKSQDRIERFYATSAQEAPERELDVDLVIPPPPKLGNIVIEAHDVAMELGGRILFENVSLSLEAGSRIGIVGRNGLGKTTLLRVLLGEILPTGGTVRAGPRTVVNYIDQGRLQLDDGKTVFQEVGGGSEYVKLGEESITLRAYLRRFLFTDERINTKIGRLSGGERSRVVLAKVLKRGGNVLVLDEPTNDLDLATLRLLEEALLAFSGAVLVVSHDRYFLNRICTGIIAFESEGRIVQTPGNYDYYLEKRAANAAPAAVGASRLQKPVAAARPKDSGEARKKMKWGEMRELEQMEAKILAAEDEVARLEAAFAAPDFYEKHQSDWRALELQLRDSRDKVAALYMRWEELESIKSAAT